MLVFRLSYLYLTWYKSFIQMKHIILFANLIFLFSYFAFSIEIPPGGTNMIDDAISNYTQIGGQGTAVCLKTVLGC